MGGFSVDSASVQPNVQPTSLSSLAQAGGGGSAGVDQDAVESFRADLFNDMFNGWPEYCASMLMRIEMEAPNRATAIEMVATYLEVAGDAATPEALRANLKLGAELVGTPYRADPEGAAFVRDLLAEAVSSGRVGADQLFTMVEPTRLGIVSDGARSLLGGITDGAVLQQLSERVLDASLRLDGGGTGQAREAGLVAAADIAVMAAENGAGRAANLVLAALAADIRAGTISISSMNDMHVGQWNTAIPERSPLSTLSALLNAVPDSHTNLDSKDRIFAALVSSATRGQTLQQARDGGGQDVSAALADLGQFFSRNAERLIAADSENRTLVDSVPSAGRHYDLLVSSFARNVLMHPDNPALPQMTDAIGNVMAKLTAVALDPAASADDRNRATQDFALLSGSLARAIDGSVSDAGRRAADQIALARVVTDQITNAALKYAATTAGPAGFIVSAAGKEQVTQFWNGVKSAVEAAERSRTTEASMPLLVIAQQFRDQLGSVRSDPGGSQLPFQFDEVFGTTRSR